MTPMQRTSPGTSDPSLEGAGTLDVSAARLGPDEHRVSPRHISVSGGA
jgi:hypothetical protein